MIDWNRMTELKTDVGAEDFAEVIEIFMEEVEGVLSPMLSGEKRSRIDEDLHFLRGSALNIGFHRFAGICAEAEKLVATGRTGDIALGEIGRVFEASKAAYMNHPA